MRNFLCCISARDYWSPEFKERRLYNDAIFYNILTIGPRKDRLPPGIVGRGAAWQRKSEGAPGRRGRISRPQSPLSMQLWKPDGWVPMARQGPRATDAQPLRTAANARDRHSTTIGMTVSSPRCSRTLPLYFFTSTLGRQVNKLLIDRIRVYFVGGSGNSRIFASVKFELNTALVIELSFPLYQISGNC